MEAAGCWPRAGSKRRIASSGCDKLRMIVSRLMFPSENRIA
jgi:hypothetical protein